MRRAAIAALAALPLGALLGLASQEADALLPHGRWIAALGVPLLAVCWAVGAAAREPLAATVAGAVTMTAATGAYYVLHFHHFGPSMRMIPIIVGWAAASLASGALFGAAGAGWRSAQVWARVAGVVLLAGALAGEAIVLAREWPDRVTPLLEVELAAAIALPFLLVRPWRALPVALVLTAGAALLLGAAEHEVRETMRQAGWRGL